MKGVEVKLDLRQLRYFESLIRNKQFTKAAKELHISQPSLSNVIKSLEQTIGCPLIYRSKRNIIPTDAGLILYNHACKLLKEYVNICKEMNEVKEVGASYIYIGFIESTKYWIPKIVKEFNKKYEHISLRFKEMSARDIESAISNYDIHFGITTRAPNIEGVKSNEIYQEELILITSINHPFSMYDVVDFSQLKGENIIQVQSGFHIKDSIMSAFEIAGIKQKGLYEVERLEFSSILVKEGLAIAIVPENYLKYYSQNDIHQIHLTNPTPIRSVYITYNENRYLTPATKYFISKVEDFFKI